MLDKSGSEAYLEYVEYLESLGVNTKAPHWNTSKCKDFRTIKHKLMRLFRQNSCFDKGDELHRNCNTRYCANPLHYTIVKVASMEKLEDVDIVEIEDISEMVDVKILKRLGFKSYFKYFNSGNPLPAKIQDFYAACNIALRRHNMRLLSVGVLTNNLRGNKCVSPKTKLGINCVNISKSIKENYSENDW